MDTPTVSELVEIAARLPLSEQAELIRRLSELHRPPRRPSETLRVFSVGEWPEGLTLRRVDEYGDDGR